MSSFRGPLHKQTSITGLFCFENRKEIFEGVHRSYKFVVFTFSKGRVTVNFPAAFMRHDVAELKAFPQVDSLHISVEMIRRLSPESFSVMEFKNEMEVAWLTKIARFPTLISQESRFKQVRFNREIDPTSHPAKFQTAPSKDRFPLIEGRNIHQFTHLFEVSRRFWVKEREGRLLILGREKDVGQKLDYQLFRLGFRKIARNTDARTMIATIIQPSFSSENFQTLKVFNDKGNYVVSNSDQIFLAGVLNSFVFDAIIRLKVTANMNYFFVYSSQVPSIEPTDKFFLPITERAAKLICTTPEFDDLAKEVGLGSHRNGVTDEAERARLRAELDGMVAHLYGLTEEEFAYILTTFPLVSQEVKDAALQAYRAFAPHPDERMLAELIAAGESARLEFKAAARWNQHKQAKDDSMKENIAQGVAAFLNSREGGALLVGVNSDGAVIGIEEDFRAANPQKPGRDSYELFLRNLLSDALGGEHGHSYRISFHQVNGRELCRIAVDPAPKPVYVKGEMYVRIGNQKRKLNAQEAVEYQKQRWR